MSVEKQRALTLSVTEWVPSSAMLANLVAADLVRLLLRYYADVRLPSGVHVGITATGLLRPSPGPEARGEPLGSPGSRT